MSHATSRSSERYRVADVSVSAMTFEAAVQRLLDAPARGERLSAHFITAHTVVEAHRDPSLRAVLDRADLVGADGMPLVWAGRLQRRQVTRVYGPDTMAALVDRGRAQGARHYLYGGAEGVPERLAKALEARYPGVEVVGMESPPFRPLTEGEDAAAVARINAARPDYVWVGLGAPKQDHWIGAHRDRLDAAALLAVGAAFDFHSGDLRQAPRWMQRSGLEWLFRLAMEPRRLWHRYTVVNGMFLWLVGRQAATSVLRRVTRGSPSS
jgi:N-acetylglucosaminyldiphosphoundecaprenol N-acetyl-beta-D-mannosaminyltransferase